MTNDHLPPQDGFFFNFFSDIWNNWTSLYNKSANSLFCHTNKMFLELFRSLKNRRFSQKRNFHFYLLLTCICEKWSALLLIKSVDFSTTSAIHCIRKTIHTIHIHTCIFKVRQLIDGSTNVFMYQKFADGFEIKLFALFITHKPNFAFTSN